MTLTEQLRDLIARDGRSLGAIAARAGVHRQTLYAWRHGTQPRPELLAFVLRALDVPEAEAAVMVAEAETQLSELYRRSGGDGGRPRVHRELPEAARKVAILTDLRNEVEASSHRSSSLARLSGVHPTTVSMFLTGRRGMRGANALALALAVGWPEARAKAAAEAAENQYKQHLRARKSRGPGR
jgi:transcriptional regulator with XRE-family HTH domain